MSRLGFVVDRARRRLAAACAAAAIVAAFSGCAWIDTRQRAKVYKPVAGTLADWRPVTARDEALWIDLPPAAPATPSDPAPAVPAPERLRAIWIPADTAGAPAVLYLHGTFRNVFFNRPKIAAIHGAGFSVLAIDYRGWGESTKLLPSETTIMQDAEAAWAEFVRRAPRPGSRVIFGHSMGSGVAVELALRHREPPAYGALVVESAMTSMPDLVRDISPLGFLLAPLVTQQFDSIDKVGRIDAPKWFLSGSADNTVPPQQTQRLFDLAPEPKALVWFDGGSHSGLHEEFGQRYREVWAGIAARLGPSKLAQGGARPASAPAR